MAEREAVAMLARQLYAALRKYMGCDDKRLVLGVMVLPERQTYYDFALLLRLEDGVEPRLILRLQPGESFDVQFLTREGALLSQCRLPPPPLSAGDEAEQMARAQVVKKCFDELIEALKHRIVDQVRTWTEKRVIY